MKKKRGNNEDGNGITNDNRKISSETFSSTSSSEESDVNVHVIVVNFRIYTHVFVIYT